MDMKNLSSMYQKIIGSMRDSSSRIWSRAERALSGSSKHCLVEEKLKEVQVRSVQFIWMKAFNQIIYISVKTQAFIDDKKLAGMH